MISRRFIGEHKYERLREAEDRADELNTTLNRNNPKQKTDRVYNDCKSNNNNIQ
jgi:hypothetical protein